MSVRVIVELEVTGTDDAEAVHSAMPARDSSAWSDLGSPIWGALYAAGMVDVDVETESIDCESQP